MGKGWSLLFGVVMLACFGLFLVAPLAGWWLPEAVSEHAWSIDRLFYIILAITGFFFVLTEAILVAFMWRFGEQAEGGSKNPGISWFGKFKPWIPDEHKLEMAWTVVPALILLYIAFAQVGTWAENKYPRYNPLVGADAPKAAKLVTVAEVSARQFEWRVRYPSYAQFQTWKKDPKAADLWSKNRYADDVWVVNEFHCVKGHPALAYLKTLDVIHSFNLPHMRVKQDVLPGKTLQAWFTPLKHNTVKGTDRYGKPRWEDGMGWDPATGKAVEPKMVWEIACAELCGWGHGRMVGKCFVHENLADYEEWLRQADREYNQKSPELASQ